MLDSLRLFAKSWPGKILGGFLLVGVAGFGINNVITDLGSNTVARVGSEEISSREFLRAYQGQLNQFAQQYGSMPTAQEALNLGIPRGVLDGLAQNAALDQMANSFGLGVSEDKLGDMLREDPNFAGTLGQFDPASFTQVLQVNGLTEAEYFEIQASAARREQLMLSLFGDVKLPETASSLVNRYAADRRTVDYIIVGENNITPPAEPTEADLTAYLTEHQAEFRTVETRTVQMMALSPQLLADAKTIPEDQIVAEYERTKANLVKVERRTIQQVVLANDEQVAAFEQGLAEGKSFETLLTENSLTATDLGTLSQAQVTDATLANAAFGLAQGGFAVIEGVAGKRAVHVSAIEAGGQTTLEEARDEIARNLALTQARDEFGDVLDQVEELRAAFQPLSEIAGRFGLDLYEADVTSGGGELAVVPSLTEADRPSVAQAIFKAEEGKLTPAIALAGNGNLWFDLEKIEPARDQTLDEVRDEVAAAWTTEKVNEAILAETEAVVARLDAGEALADVAASLNVFPQLSQPFTRFGEPETSIDGTVASAVFAGGPDHRGSAVNQAGEHVVFQVVEVTPAEGPLAEQANAQLENEARIGIYGDFVTAVSQETGMRINDQALMQALALNTGQ
jgi:peptidyl-prolyl cis-trans isomerase D